LDNQELSAAMTVPNSTVVYPQVTLGIGRRMAIDVDAFGASLGRDAVTYATGGGDLNGSQAAPLFGKAGVNASRWQSTRSPRSGGGNYCGIV
jgi:hypothetical protein